jgi:predicted PurR-regulated permease PerM
MSGELESSCRKQFLDISWGTIFKILVAVFLIYFIFLVKEIIIWLIFALVISILFEPFIKLLVRKKIPRVIAVVCAYFIVFGMIIYSVYLALPFFLTEVQNFSNVLPEQIPDYFERVSPFLRGLGLEVSGNLEELMSNFQRPIEEMSRNLFSFFATFFGGVLATFFTIALAIFISIEKGLMEKGLALIFPKKYEKYMLNLWDRSKEKVTGWFLVRIIGVVFVGLSSYIALSFLKVDYPVSFAVVAGILDFIPIIGPFIATIFIFLAVSMDSLLKAIFVFVALGLIQLIENIVLMPALTSKIIKISPVLVLISLFIGGRLWGVLGAVLLVPLVAILFEFLKDFFNEKKEEFLSNRPEREILE